MMTSYIPKVSSIHTDAVGIEILLDFLYQVSGNICMPSFDISSLDEMDGNLSAVFLAISHAVNNCNRKRCFIEVGQNHGIFFRNGLIAHLQGKGNHNPYGDER